MILPKVIIEFEVADPSVASVVEKTVDSTMKSMVKSNPLIQKVSTRIEP